MSQKKGTRSLFLLSNLGNINIGILSPDLLSPDLKTRITIILIPDTRINLDLIPEIGHYLELTLIKLYKLLHFIKPKHAKKPF